MRYTVLKADSVLRTDGKAIAKSHTSKAAFTLSAIHCFSRLAAAYSNVVHFVYSMSAISVAMDNGNLLYNVLRLLAKYIRNLLCNGIRTGDTEVCFNCIILCESLSVSVASRILR